MDKGKSPANEWTSSESDSSDSDYSKERVLHLLKKQRREFEEKIGEERREKDYWKDAYVQEHQRYQRYSRWVRDQMDMMTSRHRGQHHNFKNMTSQNRRIFGDIKNDLVMRVDEAFRQAIDAMSGMEWMVQDHLKEEVIPRYQEPWIPSMFSERVGRKSSRRSPPSRASTPPATVGLGAGPSTVPPAPLRVSRPSRIRLTARKSVRPPLPPRPRVSDDEAAAVWVDRMLDEAGRRTMPNGVASVSRPEADHDDAPEEDPEEEPEEDPEEEPEEDPTEGSRRPPDA